MLRSVNQVAARGLGFGGDDGSSRHRWAEPVRSNCATSSARTIELKLGDQNEVLNRTGAPRTTSPRCPDAALTHDKLHFLSACRASNGQQAPGDLSDGVADLVQRIAEALDRRAAPKVRLLPRLLARGRPGPHRPDPARPGIPDRGSTRRTWSSGAHSNFDVDPPTDRLRRLRLRAANLARLIGKFLVARQQPEQVKFRHRDFSRGSARRVPQRGVRAGLLPPRRASAAHRGRLNSVPPGLTNRLPGAT
ncbi:hypothetical protein GCM10020218_103480 [Dactylosporangium vinaceum]